MAEGRARNMKGREETPEKEEQGTRLDLCSPGHSPAQAWGSSASAPHDLQEVADERNLNCIPGKRYSPGAEKEGLSQAMEALNRCPGRLDSTLLKQE